jgi:hypothetical protein
MVPTEPSCWCTGGRGGLNVNYAPAVYFLFADKSFLMFGASLPQRSEMKEALCLSDITKAFIREQRSKCCRVILG